MGEHDRLGELDTRRRAAEAAIGLAILVAFYRNRGSIATEDVDAMRG